MVAAATNNLCEAANSAVQGHASEEKLISSAKQVAASTAQLLVACQVKADQDSQTMKRLQVGQVLPDVPVHSQHRCAGRCTIVKRDIICPHLSTFPACSRRADRWVRLVICTPLGHAPFCGVEAHSSSDGVS